MAINTDEASPTCPVWHPSFQQVKPPANAVERTDTGLATLDYLKKLTAHQAEAKALCGRAAGRPMASWQEMPELYRRMVVAAAGLPREVVETRDRELTEQHKVMMRSAISDMREWLGSVAAL